jgi:hypothetical protein
MLKFFACPSVAAINQKVIWLAKSARKSARAFWEP